MHILDKAWSNMLKIKPAVFSWRTFLHPDYKPKVVLLHVHSHQSNDHITSQNSVFYFLLLQNESKSIKIYQIDQNESYRRSIGKHLYISGEGARILIFQAIAVWGSLLTFGTEIEYIYMVKFWHANSIIIYRYQIYIYSKWFIGLFLGTYPVHSETSFRNWDIFGD